MGQLPGFKVGISFHSFAHDYLTFVYSFEDMMQMATELGGGVEIVGPSHHRGFPEVTDEFERAFKSSVDRYGLIPTCYGSYADPFTLPDRDLTPDEIYDYTVLQLKGAAKLGFPLVRLQYFTHPVAERLVQVAEKLDLKMGYELHSPLMIESPTVLRLREQIERLSSDRLGLIPDFGIFGQSISQHHLGMGRQLGVAEDVSQRAQELWKARTPVHEAAEAIREAGGDERALAFVDMVWGSFGYSEPAALADIKESIVHCHGKFYTIVDGDEPDLRYEEAVRTLLEIGYSGWVSTEYEGGAADTFQMAKEHQAMIHRYIAKHQRNTP